MTARFTTASLLILLAVLQGCGGTSDDVTSSNDGSGNGDGDYIPVGPSCEFGDDEDKCDGDDEQACTPIPGTPEEECSSDDQCDDGELCLSEGDDETAYCRFIHGECIDWTVEEEGARFGESCDGHEDCAGFCVPVNEEEQHFECEENCRIGATSGCGHDDMVEAGVGCVFFAANLEGSGIEQGVGDFGACATLCDCTADCPGEQKCWADPTHGYPGVCIGSEADPEITECPDTGMGGSRN